MSISDATTPALLVPVLVQILLLLLMLSIADWLCAILLGSKPLAPTTRVHSSARAIRALPAADSHAATSTNALLASIIAMLKPRALIPRVHLLAAAMLDGLVTELRAQAWMNAPCKSTIAT